MPVVGADVTHCGNLPPYDVLVPDEPKTHRFLTISQAAEELNVNQGQIRVLLRTGELRAIQVGGRGQWRIGRQDIEDYIDEAYRRTAERVAAGELIEEGEPDAETE